MKCPKCGYVSFEYLDQCKKCGRDLSQFKSSLGVVAFKPEPLTIVSYIEGAEGEVTEEVEESEIATAVEESAVEVAEEPVTENRVKAKEEIEIHLPENIAETPIETAQVSPQIRNEPDETTGVEEKNGEIELSLETEEEKEEINLIIEGDVHKEEEKTPLEVKEEVPAIEEITLSLDDIAEFDDEKDVAKKKESTHDADDIKLEIE
ncbi:MAG: hypothetical protein HY578_02055 [Nitrospinae bacterium]|nr:hypothetical protein [Nitrospinota bacterium]